MRLPHNHDSHEPPKKSPNRSLAEKFNFVKLILTKKQAYNMLKSTLEIASPVLPRRALTMQKTKDPFAILGVSKTATDDEVQKAYRKKAMRAI